MTNQANEIFFSSLRQYATDTSGGAGIVAAVAAVAEREDFNRAAIVGQAGNNIIWFSRQTEQTQIEVIALAFAVKKHFNETERKMFKERPAQMRLEYIKIAIHIYRLLQKNKTVVNEVVDSAEIRTKAAYKAVIRANLPLIREMRQRTRTKAWVTISKALVAITGKRIPPSQMNKLVSEVEAEMGSRTETPLVMTHFDGERIDAEVQAAYQKAGYENTGSAGAPQVSGVGVQQA